jgi:hypothetical protein
MQCTIASLFTFVQFFIDLLQEKQFSCQTVLDEIGLAARNERREIERYHAAEKVFDRFLFFRKQPNNNIFITTIYLL